MIIKITMLLVGIAGLSIACFFPVSESTYEFDGVNLRLRECSRSRSWLFGFIIREQCSEPQEHATASRLRELGTLAPVIEEDSQWLLMRGRKPNVRGWIGPGRNYVSSLGAHSVGTPVTLPVGEDLGKNIWVKWAVKDPKGAKHFWQELQAVARRKPGFGGYYLEAAQIYLEQHELAVVAADLEAHALREIGD